MEIDHENSSHRKTGVTILITYKTVFKTNNVTKNKEDYLIVLELSIHQ